VRPASFQKRVELKQMSTLSEKTLWEIQQIESLLQEFKTLEVRDFDRLNELRRRSLVAVRTIVGEENHYAKLLPKFRFTPSPGLGHNYPTEGEKKKAWETGVYKFTASLQSVIDELNLREVQAQKEVREVSVPEQITLVWLWNHVPMKLWSSFAGALATALWIGYAARTWQESHSLFAGAQSVKITETNKTVRLAKPLTTISTNSAH
jgi:hypothetical protein